MDYYEDYKQEPCAELYFAVQTAVQFSEQMPMKRARVLAMYNVTEEDIVWQSKQEPPESYCDNETRAGDWNRVTRGWDRIRASYNEYKNITPLPDDN
jgi:hypothetical protein